MTFMLDLDRPRRLRKATLLVVASNHPLRPNLSAYLLRMLDPCILRWVVSVLVCLLRQRTKVAGVDGIEPSPRVSETRVLPLHQTPINWWS